MNAPILVLLLNLLPVSSWALFGNIGSPSPSWDRAEVLNYDQSLISVRAKLTSQSKMFDSQGEPGRLGQKYDQRTTWGEMLAEVPEGVGKENLRAFMKNRGISSDRVAETNQIQLTSEKIEIENFWGYGVTDAWSIAINIPLQVVRTQVGYLAKRDSEVRAFMKKSAGEGNEVPEFLNKPVSPRRLGNNNYSEIEDEVVDLKLGDVELHSKHLLVNQASYTWSIGEVLRFPSSRPQALREYIDFSAADSQMDVGMGSYLDVQLGSRWSLLTYLGYTFQLSDERAIRVPRTKGDLLESEEDRSVERDLGDIAEGRVGLEFAINSQWKFLAMYTYGHKGSDEYRGEKFARERYRALESNTQQQLHLAQAGVKFSTVPRARNIISGNQRWQFNLMASTLFAGKNIPAEPASLNSEILVYF